MKALSLVLSSSVAASLIALGACSSNNDGNGVTQAEYDDVAQQVGNSAAPSGGGGDVGAMIDLVVIAKGDLPLGFTAGANGTISGAHGGLTYSYTLTCKDAQGNTLTACNSSTDSAMASLMWSGTLALPGFSASLSRSGNWSIIGLQTAKAQFDGSGTFTATTSITNAANVTTAYHFDYSGDYHAVMIDTATQQADAGTITYQIDANKDVNGSDVQSFSIAADITINSDGTASIVLDGSHDYTENLSTGVVVSAN